MVAVPPIQRSKSLHEQTYQALRTSILSGDFAPSERLVETQLAQQLQVSRTPIREALRQLQKDGLVTADGSGGLQVTSISVIDAVQLYDCRLALEQLSVAGACAQATQRQLAQLEDYVVQAEALVPGKSPNLKVMQLLNLDYGFHRLIAESSGNRWLVGLLDQVFDKMALLRVQTTQHNPEVLEIRIEHRQIYQAIAERQVDRAVAAIRSHLMASQARVVGEVQQLSTANPSSLPGDVGLLNSPSLEG
ncbi:MAG: GntR family transcriptional regulator [Synechococcales cyanobacterium M58_A2018_015]|nr:GntR family transcriptional regulator [Synechococcales cyanobacterium M58_A2018_015]